MNTFCIVFFYMYLIEIIFGNNGVVVSDLEASIVSEDFNLIRLLIFNIYLSSEVSCNVLFKYFKDCQK